MKFGKAVLNLQLTKKREFRENRLSDKEVKYLLYFTSYLAEDGHRRDRNM